jgi:sigma-B regulation protein RsbU (phosphoserine phosphatase)
MKADGLSNNVRIASLTRLTRELVHIQTPADTLRTFRQTMLDLYGPTASIMLNTRGLAAGEYRVVEIRWGDAARDGDVDLWAQAQSSVQRGGVIATMIESTEPRLFQEIDWSADPYFRELLAGYDSAVVIPSAGDRLPMNWLILLRRSPDRLTGDDLEQSLLRVALITSLLESQSLVEEVAKAHAQTDAEVRRVGQIQRALLPDGLPSIPNLQIAVSYETSTDAGGDLYDFIPLCAKKGEPGKWAVFIGDASGHGPSAAVVIAIVQALLHSHPRGITSPAALLDHLNDHLCSRPIESSFVTAFIGVYDPSSHQLQFASAGHPPPILIDSREPLTQRLESKGGYPLGIDPSQHFHDQTIQLLPGQTLLLYTDGISEARNPAGEFFGIDGIEAAIRHCTGPPDLFITELRQAVAAYENAQHLADDQTLVAIAVT